MIIAIVIWYRYNTIKGMVRPSASSATLSAKRIHTKQSSCESLRGLRIDQLSVPE